jgi:hypothetical protein
LETTGFGEETADFGGRLWLMLGFVLCSPAGLVLDTVGNSALFSGWRLVPSKETSTGWLRQFRSIKFGFVVLLALMLLMVLPPAR